MVGRACDELFAEAKKWEPEDFALHLAGRNNEPLAVILEVAERMVKDNDTRRCLALLAHGQVHHKHPLLDELEAKCVWARGDRVRGLALARMAHAKWGEDYLRDLAEVMARMLAG